MNALQIGIIGSAGPEEYPFERPANAMFATAEELGKVLAQRKCIVVTGGKGGIMEAAARGAKAYDGTTVAESAGDKRGQSNPFIDIEIVTYDLGFRGPSQLVGMCDGLIALGGGAGTLQELCVAYRMRKPTVLLTGCGGWVDRLAALPWLDERQLMRFEQATTAQDAVKKILYLIK